MRPPTVPSDAIDHPMPGMSIQTRCSSNAHVLAFLITRRLDSPLLFSHHAAHFLIPRMFRLQALLGCWQTTAGYRWICCHLGEGTAGRRERDEQVWFEWGRWAIRTSATRSDGFQSPLRNTIGIDRRTAGLTEIEQCISSLLYLPLFILTIVLSI
ncbi:hypothetical protein M408DRAFT_102372 [Serendipita vermifera MAFF 305830]|uniref:Uncharacterized protein n=1 Tax=Serendipita vermifera MAFF 305830 TaxID=933852 RepID=A0A0C3ANL0_SERVB|nr:hypothetical protein M408DRAFT_102372 [Serendipita vermifera MAFF 305830]